MTDSKRMLSGYLLASAANCSHDHLDVSAAAAVGLLLLLLLSVVHEKSMGGRMLPSGRMSVVL